MARGDQRSRKSWSIGWSALRFSLPLIISCILPGALNVVRVREGSYVSRVHRNDLEPLCGLCELCDSVVNLSRKLLSGESQETLRLHRERQGIDFPTD